VASGEVALVTLRRDAEPFLVDRPSAAPSWVEFGDGDVRIISVKAEVCGTDIVRFSSSSGDTGSETSCMASSRDLSFVFLPSWIFLEGVLLPLTASTCRWSPRANSSEGWRDELLLRTELLSDRAHEASSAVCSRSPDEEYCAGSIDRTMSLTRAVYSLREVVQPSEPWKERW